MKVKSFSCVWLFATPWTVAYQVPHPWDFQGKSTMIWDINYRKKKKTLKNTNTWWLNTTFLNNEQFTEEIREITTFLETKNNENMMIRNLEDATKAVLRGKFIEIQILPQETHWIDNLTLHIFNSFKISLIKVLKVFYKPFNTLLKFISKCFIFFWCNSKGDFFLYSTFW